MFFADLPPERARTHRSDTATPADLLEFWARTIDTIGHRQPELHPAASPLTLVDTYDLTFAGFAGEPIRGWLHVPAGTTSRRPAVVQYIGYGGGRGLAHENVLWAMAGFAHVVMDSRGQGSGWSVGDTPDVGSGPAYPGFLTRGISSPETYYYRRLYADGVGAVRAARSLPLVDPDRIAVAGISQGGAVAIAVAALAEGVLAALPDVPFLCDIARAITITDAAPYAEVASYLKVHREALDAVLSTVAYVDGAVLAQHADVPALFSVALSDEICPASTVYAAYNVWAGAKDIVEYPFNGHEGGEAHHEIRQVEWLRALV